ncbi:matrix protein [Cacao swollen shoot Togo A virus]|uniref:Matrix protein n=1 Tax=Cacao swollen shoot Togo A virus TaxID=1960254 RepID=D5LXQ1_9VIRU|nr:matrix protein [Cacao swollen shoot Togo A virus]ADE61675.1 matrix protein [Cacao swollen shoot Togo A virus]
MATEVSTRFIFIKIDALSTLHFIDEGGALSMNGDSIEFLIGKSSLDKGLLKRATKLFTWLFPPEIAKQHSSITRSTESNVYMTDATRYKYIFPEYLLVRYVGTKFPDMKIVADATFKRRNPKGDVIGMLDLSFKEVRVKEVSETKAIELRDSNPGYLLSTTYRESESLPVVSKP